MAPVLSSYYRVQKNYMLLLYGILAVQARAVKLQLFPA